MSLLVKTFPTNKDFFRQYLDVVWKDSTNGDHLTNVVCDFNLVWGF